MYSAELVYITPYLMSAEKRREVNRINSAASSRKNSVVDTTATSSAATSAAPSRSTSPAPKKEKKQKRHDPLQSAVKMSMNSRLL